MSSFSREYKLYCQKHGVPERIDLMLCDINSILRGKWLPASDIDKLINGAVRLPLSTYAPNIFGDEVPETGLGIIVGDPDATLEPIKNTLMPAPWLKGNVAQVLVEMYGMDDKFTDLSPRNILDRLIQKFSAKGLHPVVASELEFYLVQKRKNASDPPYPLERSPNAQNYDLEILSRNEDVLRDIQAASHMQGLQIDTLIAEFGPGQFEINFHHTDDVLLAADTAVLFRRLVRGIAHKHGLEATFMAKPYADFPGNGMHLHASILNDTGDNIFASKKGISPILKHAVGGVLTTMQDLQAIFAPHLNSYRRFQPNSFAPTSPNWGEDNRTAAVRLPDIIGPAARLEHRISGADINPYLAFAAILGGMLHGLENKIEPPPALDDKDVKPVKPLSSNWSHAVETFAKSQIATDIFGSYYRDIYAIVRRDEINKLSKVITPMEYKTYLSRL